MLLYGLDVCPLNFSDIRSLDFVINRFFIKLFNTNVMDTVKYCQDQFGFELPSVLIAKRIEINFWPDIHSLKWTTVTVVSYSD